MSSDTAWSLGERKRWQITAQFETRSSLHIGSSEYIHRKGIENDEKPVDINSVMTGNDERPIIPGSTLKGKLRQWLVNQNVDTSLMESVFGKEHDEQEEDEQKRQGSGGRAEFHDAPLCKILRGKQPYPYWQAERQTWVMASTAIDRHTQTALDKSLHYTEAVPPGVHFRIMISGVMKDREVNLLLAALQACRDSETGISLGAGDADGMGKVGLYGDILAEYMDSNSISAWLNSMTDFSKEDSSPLMAMMAMDDPTCTLKLDKTEIRERIKEATAQCIPQPPNLQLDVTLQFDGPFLVSDPVHKEKIDPEQPDLIPLRDKDGKPMLPTSSLRGALRSQAERIVRTLGGHCCDTATPCLSVCKKEDVANLCPVCQVFGAAGWKTTLRIHDFACIQVDRSLNRQDFVAIDRFHGGGKDEAKFAVEHSERPCFKGRLELSPRVESWGKGLLALVLRDLQEGDITFGLGANKGYGHLQTEAVLITNLEQLNPHITAFRDHVATNPGEYRCAAVPEPKRREAPLAALDVLDAEKNSTPKPNQFHNPYHFVPVKPPQTESWLLKDNLTEDKQKKTSVHSHAFYRNTTENGTRLHHGRIICRLQAETPLFIGAEGGGANEHDSEQELATEVDNYRLNGALAVPATSLRGMISSLAEAASNSAMRVLENGVLSFRKTADDPLKKIGMVVVNTNKDGTEEKLSVLHLVNYVNAIKLKHAYTDHAMMHFLEDKYSWSPQHNAVYYLPQNYSPGMVPDTVYANGKTPGILRILGKDTNRSEELQNKLHELFITIPLNYIDTQNNRFNFNQYIKDKECSKLPVPAHIRQRYQDLADERSKSQKSDRELKQDKDGVSTRWLPFHLKGAERKRDATDRFCTLPLRVGDLVWYSTEGNNVAELSFSSIWRSRVEDERKLASRVGGFFLDQELLPFNPKRKHISPAELLFGFVEDVEKEKTDQEEAKKKALSFAGKVRFSAGVLPKDDQDESELLEHKKILLKALSSPKPPSPALYFTRQESVTGSGAISKQELSVQSHQSMGRKQYLHALRSKEDSTVVQQLDKKGHPADNGIRMYPWKSLHPKDRQQLKVKVQPITPKTSFYFHLDFSNLTEWELGLLCFALRPNEQFRHKLGMGKPIGLGTVRIDLAALHTIDRKKRYADDESGDARYNQGGWSDPKLLEELKLEGAGYTVPDVSSGLDPETCRQCFVDTMDADLYRALELLGDPAKVVAPVHYPQVSADIHGNDSEIDIEEENFKWFVENDKEHHECLAPLDTARNSLPLLTRRQEVERGD